MSILQGMLPRDLLHYCQEHGLLESILVPEAPQAFGNYPPQAAAAAAPRPGEP